MADLTVSSAIDTFMGSANQAEMRTNLGSINATTVTVADEASDTTCFPLFSTAATGDLGPKSNASMTFDASTGRFGATGATLTGGTVTADAPVINVTQTWNNAAVNFDAIKTTITNTASGASAKFINLVLGASTVFEVTKFGGVNALSTLYTGNSTITMGNNAALSPSGSGISLVASSSSLTLKNDSSSSFGRINLGGTTSSFPAIKRNTTAINFRLADDSADAAITAAAATFSGAVNKVTITAPATSATLTIADGKTLTASNSITFAGTDSTTMTFPPASASVGYLGAPQNSQSAGYTFVLADSGKHIYHPSADTTPRTWTIPANASVAYPIGTIIGIVNDDSAGAITLAITSDTLRWGASTGSRTIAANGTATLLKVTSTVWRLTGDGIT